MRVVSLVPSLTETLLVCGVNVVGRTRYCIHPANRVCDIAIVGGTKQVDWSRVEALKADLVVMDREENTLEMAESCPVPWFATHVTSVDSVGNELASLAASTNSIELEAASAAWAKLALTPGAAFSGWDALPGIKSRIGSRTAEFSEVEYMIWKNPWMAASRQTFIGSMLNRIGLGDKLPEHDISYPQLDDVQPRPGVFYLFSSEPFPFSKHLQELEQFGFNGALVDGEFYSWFGVRSYNKLKSFLESVR